MSTANAMNAATTSRVRPVVDGERERVPVAGQSADDAGRRVDADRVPARPGATGSATPAGASRRAARSEFTRSGRAVPDSGSGEAGREDEEEPSAVHGATLGAPRSRFGEPSTDAPQPFGAASRRLRYVTVPITLCDITITTRRNHGSHSVGGTYSEPCTAPFKHPTLRAEARQHKEVRSALHKEVHGMSSNQRGPTLVAPELRRDLGRPPHVRATGHDRRSSPRSWPPASPARPPRRPRPVVVGRPGVGHRPRARRCRERARSRRSRRSAATVGRALDIIGGFTARCRSDRLDALRAVAGCRVGHRGRRARRCRAPTSRHRRPRPVRSTRSPTR